MARLAEFDRATFRRSGRAFRRRLRARIDRGVGHVLRVWDKLPIPLRLRWKLGQLALRPRRRDVRWEHVLLGDQCGLRSDEFAGASDWLLWSSTRLSDGPHVELLQALRSGDIQLQDTNALLGTRYAQLAKQCIALTGHFFGASSEAEVVELIHEVAGNGETKERPSRTPSRGWASRAPIVRPIRSSNCYQVVDGHHRLARSYIDGDAAARVAVQWRRGRTALQELLDRMTWLGGSREIYQPIHAPELERSWTLVRSCVDRWDKIEEFLRVHGHMPDESNLRTSLDVAAAQGWFVAKFSSIGFKAEGVELDPLASGLAHGAYGLPRDTIHTSEATQYLANSDREWDVVSCFSLTHHFALGRGPCSAEELLELLDRATRRVLFFDTGQAHEAWFSGHLTEWTYDGTERKLREFTSFDRVERLGVDLDGIGRYKGNYGRMLYACYRSNQSDPQ